MSAISYGQWPQQPEGLVTTFYVGLTPRVPDPAGVRYSSQAARLWARDHTVRTAALSHLELSQHRPVSGSLHALRILRWPRAGHQVLRHGILHKRSHAAFLREGPHGNVFTEAGHPGGLGPLQPAFPVSA